MADTGQETAPGQQVELTPAPEAAPAAPAPEAAPPEPAPAAEPTPFPSHEEFGWDEWDGGHEAFPEPLQGWTQELLSRVGTKHETALQEAKDLSVRWESMYKALSGGEDDPQLAEAQATIKEMQRRFEEQAEALQQFEQRAQAVVDKQTDRYVGWFAQTHPDIVKDEGKFDAMADLSDKLGLEWHQTVKVQQMGSKAVEEATKRAEAGKDMEDTLELLNLKYGQGGKATPTQQKKSREKAASEQLASAAERPPVSPRATPPDEDMSDLNTAIRSVVRKGLAQQRGSNRRR